jgi:hypothetical protein
MGILIDTGAAIRSTAGYNQFLALQKLNLTLTINKSTASKAKIRFRSSKVKVSLGTVNVPTPIGNVMFYILPSDTLFLLLL